VKVPRFGRLFAVLGVVAVILIPTVVATARGRATIAVRVDGSLLSVRGGTTVGDLMQRYGLHLQPGNLLDVDGAVLQRGVEPGRIVIDGRTANASTTLRAGDSVILEAGASRAEPRVRSVYRTQGARTTNPQFSLAGAPGEEIVVSGAISGKVVSATFRPAGPSRGPRSVALTFDDGPGPYTARILSVLRKYGAPATFFVIGIHARDHGDLVREEVQAGMAVGNHSWDHPIRPPFAKLSGSRMRSEIEQTEQLLLSMGIAPQLFRPPGGSFSQRVIDAARAVDSRVVLWDVDPMDWKRGRTPGQIVRAVLKAVRPGAIIELHDGGPNPQATLAALPRIITGIRAKGLRLVALGA